MLLNGVGSKWEGDLSRAAEDSQPTMVRVAVKGPGSQRLRSDVHWIDRLSELREVVPGIDFRRTMEAMSHFESHATDRRLAHELGRIGMALRTDSSSYSDVSPFTQSPSGKKPRRVERRPPLDPEALLVSLRVSYPNSLVRNHDIVSNNVIDGVFRALFGRVDDENSETQVMDEVGEGPSPAPSDRIVRVVTEEDPPNAVDLKSSRTTWSDAWASMRHKSM